MMIYTSRFIRVCRHPKGASFELWLSAPAQAPTPSTGGGPTSAGAAASPAPLTPAQLAVTKVPAERCLEL
jgi:hypothetical protein